MFVLKNAAKRRFIQHYKKPISRHKATFFYVDDFVIMIALLCTHSFTLFLNDISIIAKVDWAEETGQFLSSRTFFLSKFNIETPCFT